MAFLEFLKIVPALLQRRRTIAQKGSALKRKRGVQGAIRPGVELYCVRGVHWRLLSRHR
jgi:hypothetical protein